MPILCRGSHFTELTNNLVPPKGEIVVPVSCVEAGRWGGSRSSSHSRHFANTRLRRDKVDSTRASVTRLGTHHSDQGQVWDHVRQVSQIHGYRSGTEALEELFEASGVATEATRMSPIENQVGVVVACGGKPIAFDLFDRPETLEVYWEGLLAGYFLDGRVPPAPAPGDTTVLGFINEVLQAPGTTHPGVGLGEEHFVHNDHLTGAALVWEGAAIHVVGFEMG